MISKGLLRLHDRCFIYPILKNKKPVNSVLISETTNAPQYSIMIETESSRFECNPILSSII